MKQLTEEHAEEIARASEALDIELGEISVRQAALIEHTAANAKAAIEATAGEARAALERFLAATAEARRVNGDKMRKLVRDLFGDASPPSESET